MDTVLLEVAHILRTPRTPSQSSLFYPLFTSAILPSPGSPPVSWPLLPPLLFVCAYSTLFLATSPLTSLLTFRPILDWIFHRHFKFSRSQDNSFSGNPHSTLHSHGWAQIFCLSAVPSSGLCITLWDVECHHSSQSAWWVDGLREPWVHLPSRGRSPKGGNRKGNWPKTVLMRCGETGLSKDRAPTGLSAVPAT